MARRPARIEVFGLVRPGDIHEMPWEDAPAFLAKLREDDRDFYEVLDRGEPPLNERMEFDHVIQVHADGSVTDANGVYAPTLYDGEVDDKSWTLMNGYSGQDRYAGPIMHNSEFIGGRMEDDILAEPGYYVALVSSYSEDADGEDDEEGNVEGWAVARKDVPS